MVYGFLIQTLVIHINMVWNHFHKILHELIGYALALVMRRLVGHRCMVERCNVEGPRGKMSDDTNVWRMEIGG